MLPSWVGREEGEILFPVLLQALKWQCYLKRSYRGWGRGSGSLGKVFTRKHEPLSSIPNAHIEKKGRGGGGGSYKLKALAYADHN